jgi:tetratricopeptide (TPR) repeat protein
MFRVGPEKQQPSGGSRRGGKSAMCPGFRRFAIPVLLVSGTFIGAQDLTPKDRPKIHVPLKSQTKNELDHREAVKLYGIAMLHEKANRLLEAVRVLEQARQLDPDAAPVHRALCPLYLALDRTEDGLSACRKAVDLDPGDYESWYLLARQYRGHNRSKEAVAALDRATQCDGLKEHPEQKARIWFDLGVLHETAGEHAAAEKALREVITVLDNPQALLEDSDLSREQITTQAAETYERLGRVCLKAGRYDAAIEAFRGAQKKDKRREARLAYNLAEVYEARGDFAEALRSLNIYLQSQPQGTEAHQRRIALLEKLGRSDEVLPGLQTAADADKYNIGLKLLLAAQYGKRNRKAQAEDIYQALLKTSPSVDVYRGLMTLSDPADRGEMLKILSLLDETMKAGSEHDNQPANPARAAEARAMLQVLREEPKLVGGLLSAIPARMAGQQQVAWETRYYLAVLAARAGKLDQAETLYRTCLTGYNRLHEAEAYSGLLQVLTQARKHKEIIDLCRQGLQSATGTSRVLFEDGMAHAYLALDKLDQAVEAATQAADHADDQNRCYCRRMRAHILAQAGRTDDAIEECQGMLKEFRQAKDIRAIRYSLSNVYSTAKRSAEAAEQLQLILEQDPNDATANNDLGYMWADEGKNLEEAEKLIRKALSLEHDERTKGKSVGPDSDRENAAYVDSLGWVLFRLGRLPEARKELERAVTYADGRDDPVVWDHLGDVCARLNDPARARACWQKAVELYDQGLRRKADDRYKDIKQKLK